MRRLVVFAVTLFASPTFADVVETRITLASAEGQEVVGTLALPEAEAPPPVVLLLHGFSGQRHELEIPSAKEGVFVRTARALAGAGYASLRIDFRGSGESTADLSFADTTFSGQLADALAAIQYLKGSPDVDGEDVHVIGWSQGGLVAAAAAGGVGDQLDSVTLWNAVADPFQTFEGLFGEDGMAEGIAADADEEVGLTMPWGAEVTLKGAFFHEIQTFDPIAQVAGFSGPMLVVQGGADTVVDPASAEAYLDAHKGEEMLWATEMDHVFNVFGDTVKFDQMVGATIAFLKLNTD